MIACQRFSKQYTNFNALTFVCNESDCKHIIFVVVKMKHIPDDVSNTMVTQSVFRNSINSILNVSTNNNFQSSCGKCWSVVFNLSIGTSILILLYCACNTCSV